MTGEVQHERGRWAFPGRLRGGRAKAHLISSVREAFCGRPVSFGEVMPPDWDPEDHIEEVCPKCLAWWRIMRPKQSGKNQTVMSGDTKIPAT